MAAKKTVDTAAMNVGLSTEWKILAVSGGFYFFGKIKDAPEGYLALTEAAMFGGFGGNLGLPGVARGAKESTVILDRFAPAGTQAFPLEAVLAVFSCIPLYDFAGTTIRA